MNRPKRRHLWPELAYNPITALGTFLALFALAAIVIFYFLSLRGEGDNPYTGIFTLVVFPGVLVIGLLLIPAGMLLEKRRQEHGHARPFVVDLKNPAHLRALVVFGAGTAVFMLATTIGLYETYHFTESVQFCGSTCHVMTPEKTAHAASSHARVACVHCHVGPGGDDYLKSKMAGARQLWHFAMDDYHRPIETPVYSLRPARETCEECHWSTRTHPPTVIVRDHYLSDRENRHWRVELLFNTAMGDSMTPSPAAPGGAATAAGIHWHVAAGNTVTYVASDSSRQSFDQVSWSGPDGKTVTYRRPGAGLSAADLERKETKGLTRTMDCLDCHNRPAHRYLSPVESVNRALTAGKLDASIPWIKREAVRALTGRWESSASADTAIAGRLERFYGREGITLPAGT
ncbi:MAG TPA: NapC/NirT family cytochrome c, partial [Candidatus Eisenbacteria bacterium]